MEENLFGETGGEQAPQGVPDPAGETPPAVQDNASAERFAALESAISETNQAVMSLTRTLASSAEQAVRAEAAAERAAGAPDMDEFRAELVQDPAGTIDRRAQVVVERLAGEQLNPTLNTIIETTHETLLAKHEAQIARDFGEEAWEKVIAPAVAADVNTLRERNIRALADPTAIKALVDRQVGMNWRDLSERQATTKVAQEKAKAEEISTGLPQGGQPRVRLNPDQPDEDVKTFWADIEGATGEKIDKPLFMKLHQAGNTIDDYLAVVGKGGK